MSRRGLLSTALLLFVTLPALAGSPISEDPRLVVELVAREPDIVTPTGLAVDEAGRVWAIENNTHERPDDYRGYPSDRIRVFDLDMHGRVQGVHTFADGFRNAMSLALGRDGAVYLATRSEVYRLHGGHGQLKADERRLIVRLDSPGAYPHNGLSGLTFDPLGNLYFSLGENLGAPYRLIGSDGVTLSGGGEGGSIYHCRPDGTGLVRMATGFWNTFGLGFDAFGRLFAVDNDPDSRGPCRLVHVVPGGDYGFRFRNGRKGLHPFTAWDGELPGTLPMVAGTSEAPCAVVAYEHRGLPAEYRGQLLVTSWGDHLIERFALQRKGASFTSHARPLIRGGEDFRPVAMAVAPDGSLFVSDWVDKSYPVHGKGRIWHIRWKQAPKDDGLRPSGVAKLNLERLRNLLDDPRGEIRIAAATALASHGEASRSLLANVAAHDSNSRGRVAALWAGVGLDQPDALLRALVRGDSDVAGEAVHQLGRLLPDKLAKRDESLLLHFAQHDPALFVQMQAILGLRTPAALERILPRLADADPFIAGAALTVLGRPEDAALLRSHLSAPDPRLRLGILIALRRARDPRDRQLLPKFLADPAPAVRRAAIQWVGEDRLRQFEPLLKTAATRPPVTRELFEALLATNAFLHGQLGGQETSGEQYIGRIVTDEHQPPVIRALALRMLPPDNPALKPTC